MSEKDNQEVVPAELEEVSGYIATLWECPECLEQNEEEGDAEADEVVCESCDTHFIMRRT